MQFLMRSETQDYEVFHHIITENEYRLPDALLPGVVIDLGANIGCFTVAAAQRGAEVVVALEPFPDNFNLLCKNTAELSGRVIPLHMAVWRSDKKERLKVFQNKNSTASCVVLTEACVCDDRPKFVPSLGLDQLIDMVTEGGARRVSLLKIDVEGAEYPALFTSQKLHLVDEIIGETHDHIFDHLNPKPTLYGYDFNSRDLFQFLSERGFHTITEPESTLNDCNTLFWSHRNPGARQCNKPNLTSASRSFPTAEMAASLPSTQTLELGSQKPLTGAKMTTE